MTLCGVCTYKRVVFSVGVVIGANIAISLMKIENEQENNYFPVKRTQSENYAEWFQRNNLARSFVDYDEVSYGNKDLKRKLESEFLFNKIHIICTVFVKKLINLEAIKYTWGKKCNELVLISLRDFNTSSVIHISAKNSWHFLCDSIRHLWKHFHNEMQWVIFVPDDMFVIPENLRYYVAFRDHKNPHYLGHALALWGQMYNHGQAGYVVSKGALSVLQAKFNTSEECCNGGKYWKNEDFYLGKHLGELGISPEDTRDDSGRGRFHGYNFNQLLFKGKMSTLGSYWKRSIFPISEGRQCCSDSSITFHGIEADKIYLYDYLLNHLKVFRNGGHIGNKEAATEAPEDEVWKSFLREEGFAGKEVSAEEFYELWKNKISAPDEFNQRVRNENIHILENLFVSALGNNSVR